MVDLWNPSPKPSIFPIFGSINGNHQWKPSIFTIFTGNHQWIMGAFRDPDFPLLQPIRWRIKKSPGAVRKSSVDMDVSHRPTHWGYHLSNKYLSDSDLRNSKNRTWRPTQPVENCSFTGKMTENDKKPWDSGSGILGKSTYHSWRFFGKQQCSSDFLQYKWTQNHLVSSNDEMLLVDAWGLYVGKNKSLGMFTFFSNGNRPAWPRARRVWRIAYSQYTLDLSYGSYGSELSPADLFDHRQDIPRTFNFCWPLPSDSVRHHCSQKWTKGTLIVSFSNGLPSGKLTCRPWKSHFFRGN